MTSLPRSFPFIAWFLGTAPLAGCAAIPEPEASGSPETAGTESSALGRTAFVVTEIQAANAALDASARAEKYAAMKESPFAFYRGSNHLYWKDFGGSPDLDAYGGIAETRAWLGGDMHVNNTGSFDDDQGTIVFGVSDFDEATLGDYQLDVWRLAISLVLVARQNGVFTSAEEATIVDAFTEGYLDAMAAHAGTGDEKTKNFTAASTYGLLDDFLSGVASSQSRTEMLDDWTVKVAGVRQLDTWANPDLAALSPALDTEIRGQMASYRATLTGGGSSLPSSHFQVKSVAARLHAGVGSLGVPRYYVLIEGASSAQEDDRILDVKAQAEPTAWAYADPAAVDLTAIACGGNMGYRVVLAEKALGYRVDDHLGWMALSDGRKYSVRERSPWKETFPVEDLTTIVRFTKMAEQWGQVLAAHHARADQDWDASVVPHSVDGRIKTLVDGDHAGFRALVRALTIPYADQVELDYQSFLGSF